jgi:hypothetical protein
MSEEPTGKEQFTILAYDRATGQVRWQQTPRVEVPHEGHQKDNTYASASAVTDGEVVVAFFGSHGLYAYNLSGKLLWQKDLGRQRTRNGFGEGSSPALYGDTVIVVWDHEGDDFIVALYRIARFEKKSQRFEKLHPYHRPVGHLASLIHGVSRTAPAGHPHPGCRHLACL